MVTGGSAYTYDIVICGGSFVGLALARALAALAPDQYRIAVIEKRAIREEGAGGGDSRTAAITSSVKAMLRVIDVWPRIAEAAQPIYRIELTDSALDAPIRPSLLELDAREAPEGEPTAYIVENKDLRAALLASLQGIGAISWFSPDRVQSFESHESQISASLGSGAILSAKLLIAADGQDSELRRMAGIQAVAWPSRKVGIVATLGIERPHNGVAWQHFLPAGPFAILPMMGNRVSIVWTEDADRARAILASGGDTFLREVEMRMGPEFGALTLLSKPAAYPLRMTLAREFVRPRFALAGDAAHGLHWIAGQGLNHGLKDAAALAETLIEASRLGLDIGSLGVLKRYERWRRFDSTTSAYAAAALNGLFSNDSLALRMLRSFGLRVIDRLSPMKTALMKEAAGLTGELPKLLRGEAI